MPFKATKAKKGLLEVHGLEAFIEKKMKELKKALGIGAKKSGKKPTAKKTKKATRAKKAKRSPAKASTVTPLATLLTTLDRHPRRADLVRAGRQKDQLLRSLVPLYLVRKSPVEVSSGTTSKFWAKQGVKYLAPNAAKALREHVGYARRTRQGLQITPNGIKYVEGALAARRRAA